MEFAAINPTIIDEDVKQYMSYCYSFTPEYCLFGHLCRGAGDFLQQFDRLIDDFLTRGGIRQYIAGNVAVVADYDERKLSDDDIDYCDAIAATFMIFDHPVIIRPCTMGRFSDGGELKLGLNIKIPDHSGLHLSVQEAVDIIHKWVDDDRDRNSEKLVKENPYVVNTNDLKNITIVRCDRSQWPSNSFEKLRNDVDKLTSDVAELKSGDANHSEQTNDRWYEIVVSKNNLVYSTERAFKFQLPANVKQYGGWCFWWPKKRVRTDKVTGQTYLLGYTDENDRVNIERLKCDGLWDKDTNPITIRELKALIDEAPEIDPDHPF